MTLLFQSARSNSAIWWTVDIFPESKKTVKKRVFPFNGQETKSHWPWFRWFCGTLMWFSNNNFWSIQLFSSKSVQNALLSKFSRKATLSQSVADVFILNWSLFVRIHQKFSYLLSLCHPTSRNKSHYSSAFSNPFIIHKAFCDYHAVW